MGIFFSFKKPVIRQFNYTPRYYDPQKEEMKERRERIARELKNKEDQELRRGDSDNGYASSLERGFISRQRKTGSNSSGDGSVWIKAIVITVIVAITYYLIRMY